MKKLFEAIREQHPGCEVVDIRFLVNKLELDDNGHDVVMLDAAMADAVRNAGEPQVEPPTA